MLEYNDIIDKALKKWTQKYEGTYAPKEIELNKSLVEACSQKELNLAVIEELLKQGADPLGGTELFGWGLGNHIYGNFVAKDSWDSDSINLPQLTALFLGNGMNIDSPRIPYDGDFSMNPLWFFSHIANENSIVALKMLLDHGLSAESFAEFWHQSFEDYCIIDCGDPKSELFWIDKCTWTCKMLLLGASYDHILKADESLREFVCCNINSYDIHNFRNWDDYEYFFDTSNRIMKPAIEGSVLHICDKKSGNEVWTMGIGYTGRRVLNAL